MTFLAQLLGIEKGNPIGIFVLLTATLVSLGWWIYSSPGRTAAKHLIEFRRQMVDWQADETARYEKLAEKNRELQARLGVLEGKLARLKAQHQITED